MGTVMCLEEFLYNERLMALQQDHNSCRQRTIICLPNPRLKKGLCNLKGFSVTQNTAQTEINPSHSTRPWEICMDAIGIQSPQGYLEQSSPALWFYRFHNLTDDIYKSLSYFPFARQFLKLNFKDTIWKYLRISKLNTYQFQEWERLTTCENNFTETHGKEMV